MSLILNIGLAIDGDDNALPLARVIEVLGAYGFAVQGLRVVRSDTESTAVVAVDNPANAWGVSGPQQLALHWVSDTLRQEAIAAFEPRRGHGVLVGPNAAAWGAFNPALFWTLEGRRLSPLCVQHAWASATRDQSEDRAQPFSLEQLAALGRRSIGDATPAWLAA